MGQDALDFCMPACCRGQWGKFLPYRPLLPTIYSQAVSIPPSFHLRFDGSKDDIRNCLCLLNYLLFYKCAADCTGHI